MFPSYSQRPKGPKNGPSRAGKHEPSAGDGRKTLAAIFRREVASVATSARQKNTNGWLTIGFRCRGGASLFSVEYGRRRGGSQWLAGRIHVRIRFWPRHAGWEACATTICRAISKIAGFRPCGVHARLTRRQPPHARARALPGTTAANGCRFSLQSLTGFADDRLSRCFPPRTGVLSAEGIKIIVTYTLQVVLTTIRDYD